MAALYLNHPYGRPVIGWHQEIEKLNREDALAFYKRFYAPNNAILVIAGDVNANEIKPMAERTFGPVLPQPAIPAKRTRPQEPTPIAARTVTLADPRVEQPTLRRYYLAPSAATAAAVGPEPAPGPWMKIRPIRAPSTTATVCCRSCRPSMSTGASRGAAGRCRGCRWIRGWRVRCWRASAFMLRASCWPSPQV